MRTGVGRIALGLSVVVLALSFAASSATASGSRASRALPAGAERFGGGWAVPISTKGPAWYDTAYFHKVMRAGINGARLPQGASMPKAVGMAYPGIRPGLWLVTVTANTKQVGFAWCTANFVFSKSGAFGLGTAGHCAARDALGAYPDVTAYVV